MSSVELTRNWLQNVLKPYAARDRLVQEVLDVLAQRRTLAVKTDAFTFNSGQTSLLLLLHGTLPINYRGATYHIPIHLWIPTQYPRDAPMAFVVPTKEMGVRKGREVEPGGRVREEVVDGWWNSWQEKSIEMLLRQLTAIFEVTPPVYAKPPEPATNGGRASPIASAGGYAAPSLNAQAGPSAQPPPPPARPQVGPPPLQAESLPQYRPAPTPPPNHPLPHSRQASASYPIQQPPHPPSSPHSPAIPQRPQSHFPPPVRQGSLPPDSPTTGPAIPQRPPIPVPQQYVEAAGPATPPRPQQPPYPRGYPAQSPPPMSVPGQAAYPPEPRYLPEPQYAPPPPPGPGYPAPQSTFAPPYPAQPTPPPVQPLYHPQAALQPRSAPHPPAPDLLSSPTEELPLSLPTTVDSTNPPPLPTSKPPPPSTLHLHSLLLPHLSSTLSPLVHSLQATRQTLLDRHEDLASGEPAIRDEMARLEAVRKVCDSVGRKVGEVVERGEERVGELERRGEVGVDEVVCGISIVHNQLIDLVAEDNAIEDTIYHMTRALDAERIDLDRFLKSVRSLAREQYMKRALIERILEGMGQKQGW